MNKKIIIIIAIICILLFPIRFQFFDGGSTEYKALTYQIIKWHRIDNNYESGYKEGIDIHLFPFNFKSFDYYTNTIPQRMEVIVNDKRYLAYTGSYSWCNDYNNCESAEKLMVSDFNSYEAIDISDSSSIKLKYNEVIDSITVYQDTFDNVYATLGKGDGLVIPSKKGKYMIKVCVKGENNNNKVDYYFLINKI